MDIPYDVIINIYSYLGINEIIELLNYEDFKSYMNNINIHKNEIWYRGIFNNLMNRCFICESIYNKHFIIICLKCEMLIGEFSSYPVICDTCIKYTNVVRGKILCSTCPSCRDERMHVAITPTIS